MKFSKTTEYALRTLAFMSSVPREPLSSGRLHRELGIPPKYLKRLLTDLARRGLIRSIRGRAGGYLIAHRLGAVKLADIIDAVEGLERAPRCFFGLGVCLAERPCVMHNRWVRHHRSLIDTLTKTSLADIVSRTAR